jgi:hypothetical protein
MEWMGPLVVDFVAPRWRRATDEETKSNEEARVRSPT